MAPYPTPLPLARLHCAWTFVHVGEYDCSMRALAPTIHVAPLVKTIVVFHHLHPLVEVDLHSFVDDFHPKMDLVLDKKAFIFVLMHSPHPSSDGSSIWCMNFCKIPWFVMILLVMALTFF
jgi:hypothetical protein